MISSIVAIIVTYEPEPAALGALLDRMAGEVMATVVVDNGSAADIAALVDLRGRAAETCLPLGRNLGIAAAQNRGIAEARRLGADAVILFDQDSAPPAGMVTALAATFDELEAAGRRPAAVGPLPIDARLSARPAPGSGAILPVDHLIASGCLIPLRVLDAVGGMREDLFIDYVDIEWCLRAKAAGHQCYEASSVRMPHEFGAPVTVLGRAYASHGPLRHYFLFRNTLWLWRQGNVPLGWRLRKAPRVALRLLFNLVFARPHLAQWAMMRRGLADGLAGRLGPGPAA